MKNICYRLHTVKKIGTNVDKAMRECESFEEHQLFMEHLLDHFARMNRRVILVLDDFHRLSDNVHSKQSFLYSLLDCVHEKRLRFSIIATTHKIQLKGFMEKRVQSRMKIRNIIICMNPDAYKNPHNPIGDMLRENLQMCATGPGTTYPNLPQLPKYWIEEWNELLEEKVVKVCTHEDPFMFMGGYKPTKVVYHYLLWFMKCRRNSLEAEVFNVRKIAQQWRTHPNWNTYFVRYRLRDMGLCEQLIIAASYRLQNQFRQMSFDTIYTEICRFYDNPMNTTKQMDKRTFLMAFEDLLDAEIFSTEPGFVSTTVGSVTFAPVCVEIFELYKEWINRTDMRETTKTEPFLTHPLRNHLAVVRNWAVRADFVLEEA